MTIRNNKSVKKDVQNIENIGIEHKIFIFEQ